MGRDREREEKLERREKYRYTEIHENRGGKYSETDK